MALPRQKGVTTDRRPFLTLSMRARLAKYTLDLALWGVAVPIAFLLRTGELESGAGLDIGLYLLIVTPIRWALLLGSRLERRSWRRATLQDLVALGGVVALGTVIGFLVGLWIYEVQGFPRTAPLISGIVALMLMGGARLIVRLAYEESRRNESEGEKRVLLVGAGDAGSQMVREMRRHGESGLEPVGFLDDDPAKNRLRVAGVPVLGTTDDLATVLRRHPVDELLITMPSASGEQTRRLVDAARAAKVPVRILPSVAQLLTGDVGVGTLRKVEVEDILRREPVEMDPDAVGQFLHGRVVLVTGAGGSIGSELVRQIARFRPGRIVMLGQGENSLHDSEQHLLSDRRQLDHAVIVGSVTERTKVAEVLAAFRPEIVFHAAAYKHVPMLEHNPDEAILNNVGGTKVVAEESRDAGVRCFVNVSTDKAVNPVSFLGYTKLLGEKVVHEIAGGLDDDRSFVSVRFGNVLGSRGSVIPIFQRQIAAGGPVTITDPAMTRFFMTIPEASQLVLQAGALAENGFVYVLDMGKPVRIEDLAKDLIRLSGRTAESVEIVATGRRPGEKMHEELFAEDEHPSPTAHPLVLAARAENGWSQGFMSDIDGLLAAAAARDWSGIDEWMAALFPTYASPGEWMSAHRRFSRTRHLR